MKKILAIVVLGFFMTGCATSLRGNAGPAWGEVNGSVHKWETPNWNYDAGPPASSSLNLGVVTVGSTGGINGDPDTDRWVGVGVGVGPS